MLVTLCDPRDRSPPGSSVYGDSPRRNTGVGCHSLLQGIFPTQGSNLGLLHYRQILYGQTERKPLPSEENPTNHFNQLSFLSCVSLKSFSLNRVRMINTPSNRHTIPRLTALPFPQRRGWENQEGGRWKSEIKKGESMKLNFPTTVTFLTETSFLGTLSCSRGRLKRDKTAVVEEKKKEWLLPYPRPNVTFGCAVRIYYLLGTSLAVQWLRLSASTAGHTG